MILHKIDKPDGGYTTQQLDEFMVFCILDTAVPYEMVCRTWDALKKNKMTTRKGLRHSKLTQIIKVLRSSGYRFPNQHAKRLKMFAFNPIDLKRATRDEIVDEVNGVNYKLASMFLRNTRGLDYAVMDVHTRRWLREYLTKHTKMSQEKLKRMKYDEEEGYFKAIAKLSGKTTKELDLEIWDNMRVGNRK